MDFQILNTELTTDPLGRGYSGMTDAQAASDINTEYRDVNYPIQLDGLNIAIRENGKWTEFRERADLQTTSGTYDFQSMREFMDLFISLTGQNDLDMQSAYMDSLIDSMVTEGSMGGGVAAALKVFGVRTVSRGAELGIGTVAEGDVQYTRTL